MTNLLTVKDLESKVISYLNSDKQPFHTKTLMQIWNLFSRNTIFPKGGDFPWEVRNFSSFLDTDSSIYIFTHDIMFDSEEKRNHKPCRINIYIKNEKLEGFPNASGMFDYHLHDLQDEYKIFQKFEIDSKIAIYSEIPGWQAKITTEE